MATLTTGFGLESEILSIFSEVTRYPPELFEPEASLEEDLGIDSVKLGEVFSVLRARYDLPLDLGLTPKSLANIRSITQALEQHLQAAPASPPQPAPVTSLAPAPTSVAATAPATVAPQPNHTLDEIRSIFAEVTRYPREILEPRSLLEEDLGIDSVKLGEVLSVIRERYHLADHLAVDPAQLKTIAGIAEAVAQVTTPPGAPVHVHTTIRTVVEETTALPVTHPAPAKPHAGKVVFISGSGRGLGKDIALYLAQQGASVIVNSFHSRSQGEDTVAEIEANGGTAFHAWGSVANPDQLDAIFRSIEQEFGGLDFFVSNASNGMLARLDQITPEHWEKAFRTNVVGLHQSSLRAVELMKRRGAGKIVTLSSPASHGYVDYFGCMGAVKAAVESLTKSMAIEFAPHNITVNCVSPGPIYGELLDKWPESKRLIAEWEDATVCGRLCEARDVSHFVSYLLGQEVKLFTGSVLVMDGGISVRWG